MELITGVKGTPHITPLQDSMFYRGVLGSETGVFSQFSEFSAVISSGTEVTISDGIGFLQGRLFCIDAGSTDVATLDAGAVGYNRKDLIVARYTADAVSATQSMDITVITGSPTEGEAIAPEPTTGNIDEGATVVDFPLYVATFEGATLTSIEAQFEVTSYGQNYYGDFTRILIPASGWVDSSAQSGYKENVISQKSVFDHPEWNIAPAEGSVLPTSDQQAAYNDIAYMVAGDTLTFYSESTIATDVYVYVQGVA